MNGGDSSRGSVYDRLAVPEVMRAMRMLRSVVPVLVLALFVAGLPPGVGAESRPAAETATLKGRLLVASPKMRDPRFSRSVVYMVDHDAKGALGLIVNKVYGRGSVANLMRGYGLDPKGAKGDVNLHFGGPVSPKAAFILHSGDYAAPRSRKVDGAISFTVDIEVLSAYASGEGPKRLLFALGYAGWAPGQLDSEIQENGWLHTPADLELVFDSDLESKWERAINKLGIDVSFLSSDAGHA